MILWKHKLRDSRIFELLDGEIEIFLMGVTEWFIIILFFEFELVIFPHQN